MKTNILFLLTTLFAVQLTSAQVLLNDTFDVYTLGNLGTDFTGQTPGQGNWLTEIFYSTTPNSTFTITNEVFKGKALTFTTQQNGAIRATKDLSIFINQRTTGNDVIKFEIDYYTGSQYYMATNSAPYIDILLTSNNNNDLLSFRHQITQTNYIYARSSNGLGANNAVRLGNGNNYDPLPIDTWVSLIVYLDYNNKKIYFETPYFNKVVAGDFLDQSTSNNLIEDFKPTSISLYASAQIANASQMVHRFDNIKITALKVIPPNILSINEQLATKFSVFPNPANDIVTITNSENIGIEQIEVFDMSGKTIKSQLFDNENEVQLTIENLAAGIYMLHIKSKEGMAVKKITKN